jgi:hypothetical protein
VKKRYWRISFHLFTFEWSKAERFSFSCKQAIKASKIVLRSLLLSSETIIWIYIHVYFSIFLLIIITAQSKHREMSLTRTFHSIFFTLHTQYFGSKSRWSGNLITDCGFLFTLNELCVEWFFQYFFTSSHSLELEKKSPFFVYHVYQWVECWCKTISNAVLFDAFWVVFNATTECLS